MTQQELNSLFQNFNKLNVLVIGDVMIDSYVWGKVERISPEAPVPIVNVTKREHTLGGASNVVKNLHALQENPILCTVIGNDDKADLFFDLIKELKLSTQGIIKSDERRTTTKFRVMSNQSQMLRVDEEDLNDLSANEYKQLTNAIDSIFSSTKIDVIIFEDYDKGVITPALIKAVTQKANTLNIPVAVDPKKKNFSHYMGVTLFKPNLKEIKEGLKVDIQLNEPSTLTNAINTIHNNMQCRMVLTTLSEHGIFISDNKHNYSTQIPAHKRDITDVSGAGDTVISVASLCLALNQPANIIALLSNLAGGLVCEKIGAVPINKQQLLSEAIKHL